MKLIVSLTDWLIGYYFNLCIRTPYLTKLAALECIVRYGAILALNSWRETYHVWIYGPHLPTRNQGQAAPYQIANLTNECGHETKHKTKVLQLYRMPEINL